MALTNVAMWTSEGWKSVTIEEAVRLFPYATVSANSHIFMCRLCKNYVTLTAPGVYARCFKHSRGDIDKDCDERTDSFSISHSEIHEFIPPIRIKIENDHLFSLELGFILPPKITDKSGTIAIKAYCPNEEVYQYNISRLNENQLTYLSVGSNPADVYNIDEINNQIGLPKKVNGVNIAGAMFNYNTGKKLPDDADVIVDQEYLFLTWLNLSNRKDVSITEICRMNNWKVYKVKALTMSKYSASFFLHYGYLLTEKQSSITFLWPEYIVSPYVIRHDTGLLHLYIQGDAVTPKVYPQGDILDYRSCDNNNGLAVAVSISRNERQQLLSVGRTNVLRYTYLWKEKLDNTTKVSEVKITDIKGNEVNEGKTNRLPEKKILQILPEFDGYVEIINNDWITEKRKLRAGEISEIDQIQFGMSISVFQGLDCIWSVFFVRAHHSENGNDSDLLTELQNAGGRMIPVSHLFGAIAVKYEGYPLVQKWIYTQVRKGCISEKAYKMLRRK